MFEKVNKKRNGNLKAETPHNARGSKNSVPAQGLDTCDKAETPKKVRGYTVAPTTTDKALHCALREADIETSGGRNTRHFARSGR